MRDPAVTNYEDNEIGILDVFVALAESWRLMVFGPLLAGVLAGSLSFLWPKTFESVSILRLNEEEASLLYAAPVLDLLIDKFGYLQEAGGIKEDARSLLMKDLAFSYDKKTKLTTLVARGYTPDVAQAVAKAAIDALLIEIQPKGKEKQALMQEIANNELLISEGIFFIGDRHSSKQQDSINNVKKQIANLKVTNLELALRLQIKGDEVFVQKPTLPQRKSSPKLEIVLTLSVLISGFALLLFIYLRTMLRALSEDAKAKAKLSLLKSHIFG